jgi:hypothetical protein
MSFRLFIFYCALCGGWSAYFGWFFGRLNSIQREIPRDGIKGMFVGLMVALGLSLVDALWNVSFRQVGQVFLRVSVAVVVGCVGGLMGGLLGSWLFYLARDAGFLKQVCVIFGWTLTGFLIGASIGVFELMSSLVKQEDTSGATRKLVNGILGGTVGGALGGLLFVLLNLLGISLFSSKGANLDTRLWSPSSYGFVALGACIGLLIGLAQVIFMEAWIKVESGFRAGREKILAKGEISIGRAESCDIGLFGDNTIERLHARILKRGNHYYLLDAGTASGTYLNGRPVTRPELLQSGDAIKVGNSVLRFGERQKRPQAQGV